MLLLFSKMHGLGNDFIVINNLELQHKFTTEQISYIADRKFGIGCDQVLIIDKATDGISDFFYRIYNSDGSIAGQCGNGARCFIRYVTENNLISNNFVQLQTLDRVISGKRLTHELFEVDMGIPEFSSTQIPLNHSEQDSYFYQVNNDVIEFYALSMGNPHAVIVCDSEVMLSDDKRLEEIGIALQKSDLFPESVNVNFIYKVDEQTLSMRTYERGCGFTLACGSGACASAVVAIKIGLVASPVKLTMPGGLLIIKWDGSNIYMQGSATHVFDGEIFI